MKTIDLSKLYPFDLFAIYNDELAAIRGRADQHHTLDALPTPLLVKIVLGSYFFGLIERALVDAALDQHRCIYLELNERIVDMVLTARAQLSTPRAPRTREDARDDVAEVEYPGTQTHLLALLDHLLDDEQGELRLLAIGETHLCRLVHQVMLALYAGHRRMRVVIDESCRQMLVEYHAAAARAF